MITEELVFRLCLQFLIYAFLVVLGLFLQMVQLLAVLAFWGLVLMFSITDITVWEFLFGR